MNASRSSKLMMMKVSVLVLSISGKARNEGTQITVNSGTWCFSSSVPWILRKTVPCLLGHDPDGQAVFRVRSRVTVLDEHVAALQKGLDMP